MESPLKRPSKRLAGRACRAVFVALLPVVVVSPASGGNFHFLLGARQLDESTWSPVDTQTLLGFEADVAPSRWPVRLTTGLQLSVQEKRDEDENLEEAMNVVEVSLGVRKLWSPGPRIRPYAGVGAALIVLANFEIAPVTLDTDTSDHGSVGLYASGGVLWRAGSAHARFDLGCDVRILRGADASFTQREGRLDYEQLTILAGFNWGKDRDRR